MYTRAFNAAKFSMYFYERDYGIESGTAVTDVTARGYRLFDR